MGHSCWSSQYSVRNARHEPDAPPYKVIFFLKERFITGLVFWVEFVLQSRGFVEIGKTSGDVKV
jgi:hypothetical protein